MEQKFWGKDVGVFAFGRKILRKNPSAELVFSVGGEKSQEFLSESDFWEKGLREILEHHTRFGRIAIFYERKNTEVKDFLKNIDISSYEYAPKEQRKQIQKIPEIFALETQVLREMALEGMADTVEFRRLARKFLRKAKHANVDTIFFLEAIFAEEKTQKILRFLAGSQRKLFFVSDFLDVSDAQSSQKTRSIQILSDEDPAFLQLRAEKILRTKVSGSDFGKVG